MYIIVGEEFDGREREGVFKRRKEVVRFWILRREGVCWGVGKFWLGY